MILILNIPKECTLSVQTKSKHTKSFVFLIASEVLKMLFGSLRKVVGNYQKLLCHDKVKISCIWHRKSWQVYNYRNVCFTCMFTLALLSGKQKLWKIIVKGSVTMYSLRTTTTCTLKTKKKILHLWAYKLRWLYFISYLYKGSKRNFYSVKSHFWPIKK